MDLPPESCCLTQEQIWDPKHLDRLSVKKNGRRSRKVHVADHNYSRSELLSQRGHTKPPARRRDGGYLPLADPAQVV